jgi:L,D-transpeptidase catalytic domain
MGRVSVVTAAAAALCFSAFAQAGVVARPRAHSLVLRAEPSGAVIARLGSRTEFDSPLVLAVAARRPGWLGVISPLVPNGKLAWVDRRTVRLSAVRLHIDLSLSRRQLSLLRGRTLITRFDVGIGAPTSPTPTGRFAVTDKLSGEGTVYGCCILALSAHQSRPPRGWSGSDSRVAIHGGGPGAISGGCLHASTSALRFLMAHVPLGTRVTIGR